MRRLTTVVPSEPLGNLRRYSGKLYGHSHLDIVEFLSMKHRISKASVRALLISYWRYLTREVMEHGETVVIPGVGRLKRRVSDTLISRTTGEKITGTGMAFVTGYMSIRYIDQEDDEDAGPREE
jgi:hypothetical protein